MFAASEAHFMLRSSIDLNKGHVRTGSRIRCVHWIERGRFSAYRFWNRVSITYRFQDIDVLVFKKDFALEARYLGEREVKILLFPGLRPPFWDPGWH